MSRKRPRTDIPEQIQGHAREMAEHGTQMMDVGNWAQAQQAWESVLEDVPDSAYAFNKLGVCFAQMDELEQAEAAFRKALENEPQMSQALSNLGNIELSRGNAQQAADLYEEAIRYQPDYSVAHHNLAAAYRKLGKIDKSVAQIKKARSIESRSSVDMRGYPAIDKSEPKRGFGGCLFWLIVLAAMVAILVLLR